MRCTVIYFLLLPLKGGAPLADVKILSTQNISMDIDIFRSLQLDVIKVRIIKNKKKSKAVLFLFCFSEFLCVTAANELSSLSVSFFFKVTIWPKFFLITPSYHKNNYTSQSVTRVNNLQQKSYKLFLSALIHSVWNLRIS